MELQIPELIKAINLNPSRGSDHQETLEKILISDLECRWPIPLFTVNFSLYGGQPLNFSRSEGMSCITKSITKSVLGDDLPRIRNWLIVRNLIKESSGDIVFRVDLSKIRKNPLFIIKTPGLESEPFSPNHEAAIGLYCLNKIRKVGIPNFAFVYGVFLCNRPFIEKGEVRSWCAKNDNPVPYLIEENIVGEPLAQLIPTLSVTEFELIFWQVLNALNVAYHRCGFTHYDLHDNNVIVRDMGTPHAVPCYDKNLTLRGYIISRYIPVIIDYGFSRFVFEYQGATVSRVSLGKYDQPSISAHEANPAADIYRFLLWSARHCLTNFRKPNLALLAYIDTKISFFEKGPIQKLLETRSYWLDYDDRYPLIFDDSHFKINPILRTDVPTVVGKDASNLMIDFYENMTDISSLFEYCDAWKIIEMTTIVNRDLLRENFAKIDSDTVAKLMSADIKRFNTFDEKLKDLYNEITKSEDEKAKYLLTLTHELVFQMETIADAISCTMKIAAGRFPNFIADYDTHAIAVRNAVRASGRRRALLFRKVGIPLTPKMLRGDYD